MIVIAMMTEDDAAVILIMVAVMVHDHNVVMILIIIIMMMMKHDDPVMTVPIAVVVPLADADRYALLRNYHRLVAVRRRRQRRRAQDCERACDKSQLVHVMFLHW
ncbi:MAG TPA: hypothetical protein VGL31_17070 [Xanthobacteraceae bacterium]